MRIAILEPHPRLCGVTAFNFHLAPGFRALGHECDVVSFNKSGRTRRTGQARAGWYWWAEAPDRTEKWAEAAAVLDGYDLIVLNEPKNGTEDRDALKQQKLPAYIEALKATRTPWTTVLHAPQYDEKRSPFMAECLSSGNFTGIAVEYQPGSYESGRWCFDGRIRAVQPWPWLPYAQRGPHPEVARQAIIGIGGRFAPNKGQQTLAYHADKFPAGWLTRLYGSESGGMGPAASYLAYEALTHSHGWNGARDGNPDHPDYGPDPWNNWGDKIKGWPWWAQRDGHVVQYMGPYDDGVRVWSECAVAVNLTSIDFSCSFEYTQLEAMDAGCAMVVPAHIRRSNPGNYQTYDIESFTTTMTIAKDRGYRLDRFSAEASAEIPLRVTEACNAVTSGEFDPGANRRALTELHDPSLMAGAFLSLHGA